MPDGKEAADERIARLEAELTALKRALPPPQPSRLRRGVGRLLSTVVVALLAVTASTAAQLVEFQPGQPALASAVNANFQQLKTWIEQKVGTVGSEAVIVTGTLNASGGTTITGGLTASGGIDLNGTLTTGNITMDDDADITGVDIIQGHNDLRLYGDGNGGPDLLITAAGNVQGLTATLTDCDWVDDSCEMGGDVVYLDRANNMACPSNKVMTQWDVDSCGGSNYRMRYYCCSITVQ